MPDRRLVVRLRQDGPIPLDVEFECRSGDVLAIFGPSGAGKSTILRTIAGLYHPADASVHVSGIPWIDTRAGITVAPHRRAVGFVFQEYALFPHLTALGNVTTSLLDRPRRERRARAAALLERLHLSDRMQRRPHELSGGERQRVAVARALARDPAVLLMDEPFAAIDRAVRRHLHDEIDELRRTLDIPLVLVTHDFDDVVRLATHVLVLERGRDVASGPIESLMSRPDVTFLRDAVGLGSVFEAVVADVHADRGLVTLAFDGGTLLVPRRSVPPAAAVRVRIPAREVILAATPPERVSLHNVLTGTVTAVHEEPGRDDVMVQVTVGSTRLLAEVTRDAITRLGITAGTGIRALVKSVSVDVLALPPS